MKYIKAKTIGSVKIAADGFPSGNLQPKKAPLGAEHFAYSADQKEVLIRYDDDSIDTAEYGEELTESQAEKLYKKWQDEHDAKCECCGKHGTSATMKEMEHPCMANVLCGVCHTLIDETKKPDTTKFDEWKNKEFQNKTDKDFEEEARTRILIRKNEELLKIAAETRTPLSEVADAARKLTTTKSELAEEIKLVKAEILRNAEETFIKYPIKTVRVKFK